MTNFQLFVLPLLGCLMVLELWRLRQPHSRKIYRLARLVVWAIAAVLIYQPGLTVRWASFLGIARGTDLVIYIFMLLVPYALFHLYAKQFAMQRDLVLLARRDAIREAVPGQGLAQEERAAETSE